MGKGKQIRPAERRPPTVAVEQHEQLILQQTVVTHSGPLPSPETLREYSQLLPDAVDRIFALAERDQQFIQGHQLREQSARHRSLLLGQIFGFLLGAGGLAVALILALNDKSIAGAGIFLGAVGTLIGTAIWERISNSPSAKPPAPKAKSN